MRSTFCQAGAWYFPCSQARRLMMFRAVPCLLAVLWVASPAIARAQDPPAETPEKNTEERPTGLPARIKWTFNFDAGWGTFGFANSLYNNPKDPGVDENLSDQWFEGYVKPALSGELHAGVVK